MSKDFRIKDPIFEKDGKFYFWNEVWKDSSSPYGPYDSYEEASEALQEYCEQNLG